MSRAPILGDVHQEASLQVPPTVGNPVLLRHIAGPKPLQDIDEDLVSRGLIGVLGQVATLATAVKLNDLDLHVQL